MAVNDAFVNNGLYITSVMPIALRLGAGKTGVISGCVVSQQTVPNMTVKSTAGSVLLNKINIAVALNASIAINAAHATLDRYDLISVNSSGTIVYTAGTASATAVPPEIPASNIPLAVIYVAAAVTSIADAAIYDLRITVIKDFLGGYFGSGADGAVNQTTGTYAFNTQIKQFTSLTIANGAAMTFSGYGKYLCLVSGDLTLNGTVNIPDRAGTSPTYADAVNAVDQPVTQTGGNPGTPMSIYSAYLYLLAQIPAEPSDGANGAATTGGYAGGGGGGGSGYTSGGAGGAAGSPGSSGSGGGGGGGNGKACIFFLVGGNISIGATAVFAGNGNAGAAGSNGAVGGGGGGGGAAANVLLYAGNNLALTTGAAFNLAGGTGGNGGDGGAGDGGSGGGGGGGTLRAFCYGALTTGATITVTGGSGGSFGNGGAGAAGNAGINIVVQLA